MSIEVKKIGMTQIVAKDAEAEVGAFVAADLPTALEHHAQAEGGIIDWSTLRIEGDRSMFDQTDEEGNVTIPAGTLQLRASARVVVTKTPEEDTRDMLTAAALALHDQRDSVRH